MNPEGASQKYLGNGIGKRPKGPQPVSDAVRPCRQCGAVEQPLGLSEHR